MISAATRTTIPEADEFRYVVRRSRIPRIRTIREFAESEIILPTGRWEGYPLRVHRQPFVGHWFDAIDSQQWPEMTLTGPSQCGKSLIGFVLPCMYHLFEIGETVILALPTMEMVKDKWERDLLPVLERTQYRKMIPSFGRGSRGGVPDLIKFLNGASLKFMTGGGDDKSRASFTSRVIVFTEVDGMAVRDASSKEANKVKQIEARARSFDFFQRRIYKECTVTDKHGHIWQCRTNGTESRIACKCSKCKSYVTPEREHCIGWRDASDVVEAMQKSAWHCPECGKKYTRKQQIAMNRNSVLLHRGQQIGSDGAVDGPGPRTTTFAFRWNAFNNLFTTAGDVGREEFEKMNGVDDDDDAERALCQFTHNVPYDNPNVQLSRVDPAVLRKQQAIHPQTVLPAETEFITLAADIGKWLIHWVVIAFLETHRIHIPDYGRLEVPSSDMPEELAIKTALRQLRDRVNEGWIQIGRSDPVIPLQAWIDAGYQGQQKDARPVYEFIREADTDADRFRPLVGRGTGQMVGQRYSRPKRRTSEIVYIGENYHMSWMPTDGVVLITADSDAWKSWWQRRLVTDKGQAGAVTLYKVLNENDHMSYSKHQAAEEGEEVFIPGLGKRVKWVPKSRVNHWLDASYIGCAAGSFCGFRLSSEEGEPQESEDETPAHDDELTYPDGRPFVMV